MMIDTSTVVSMTDANQNFSKVTRIVDQKGRAVIFKNNAPKYLVIEFSIADQAVSANDDEVLASSSKIMDKFDHAFAALAK
jgi:antitoxin Phd